LKRRLTSALTSGQAEKERGCFTLFFDEKGKRKKRTVLQKRGFKYRLGSIWNQGEKKRKGKGGTGFGKKRRVRIDIKCAACRSRGSRKRKEGESQTQTTYRGKSRV